jgi:hypothetical protein
MAKIRTWHLCARVNIALSVLCIEARRLSEAERENERLEARSGEYELGALKVWLT